MKHDFKVLFIYPNTKMATLVPIHISLLSACLKSAGFQVELFDTTFYPTEQKSFEEKKVELLQVKEFNWAERGVSFKESDPFEDLREMVRTYRPNIIGITLVEDTFELGTSLLRSIREFDIPIIAGGVFVTFSPEEVLNSGLVDMACIGEGEEALIEICNKMDKGEDYSSVQNIWFKKNKGFIRNPIRNLIDINKLPFIDYDIFEFKRLYRPMYGKIYTMIHIEVDRGCPYQCTYCEAPQLKRFYQHDRHISYYRRKEIGRFMSELEFLKERYHPDYINFNSESFLTKPIEELMEFSKYYKKIGIPFWCQSRPETVTEEKIKILKDMNCHMLQFGIEHGNAEFRKTMLKRYYTNEQLITALKIVGQYKIQYTVNNIIGFPDETRELIFDTININRQIDAATINCYMFTPYKGTELYKYCLEHGYITKDTKVHQLLDGAELKMKSITYQELKGLQRTFPMYVKFPKSEWPKIRVAERFDEEGNRMFDELRGIYYERYFEQKAKYINEKVV